MSVTDLDALLIAEENARARLDSLRAAEEAALDAARSEFQEKRRAAQAALEHSLATELAAIAAEADAEIALREAARLRRHTQIEARADALVSSAAALWVRIMEEGSVP